MCIRDSTFTFGAGQFTLDSVSVNSFDGTNYNSVNTGGSSFNTNAYSSGSAGLSITDGGSRTMTLSGAFFAGQTAPAIPLATAGQGRINDDDYNARFTFAAAAP